MPRDELGRVAETLPAFPENLPGGEALSRLLALPEVLTVLDVGSGDGVHAKIMREHAKVVDTISLREPADYVADFMTWDSEKSDYDALWVCHVLEHQTNPGEFLRQCKRRLRPGGYLAVTVPPLKHAIVGGHVTLWNAGLLLYQLILAGFNCRAARVGTYGYNISVIVRNVTAELPKLANDNGDIELLAPFFPMPVEHGFNGEVRDIAWGSLAASRPKHVAIVALGHSAERYMDRVKKAGSRRAFCDQTWGVNAIGDVLQCDLIFHMDDVRIQEIRAAALPQSNIATMLPWLKATKTLVMTSRAHSDYPALIEFPLEAVLNKLGRAYFNNTVSYAVAYAIYLGVEEISIFGCDFTYPKAHKAEKGRACLEFWLGYAVRSGIQVSVPPNTSLLDSIDERGEDDAVMYGYDTVRVKVDTDDSGLFRVTMTEREELPTAEQIEEAYDHGNPPILQGIKQ